MSVFPAQRSRADRSFERLYRRHVADVYRYALAVLRHPADAEDVTQTTFLNAYRAFQRGERPDAARNLLIAIAHNVCRQRFRQSARRPREVAYVEDVGEALAPDEDAPDARDLGRALGELAFNQRAALVMRELEGRSYAEIASILELSVPAVETLIFRARRALREQLEGSLTCNEAELSISKQLDGRLSRKDRAALRGHLRKCPECARFARSQRAQRGALKALAAVPLPSSLASLFGGSGSAVGTGIAAKAAAVAAAGVLAGGAAYEGYSREDWRPALKPAKPAHAHAAPAAASSLVPSGLQMQQERRAQHSRGRSVLPAAARPHGGSPAVTRDPRSKGAKKARPAKKAKRASPGRASNARRPALTSRGHAAPKAHARPSAHRLVVPQSHARRRRWRTRLLPSRQPRKFIRKVFGGPAS